MPKAPACAAYQFIGIFALRQHDGWRVEFTAAGDVDDAGFVHGTEFDDKKNGDLAPPSKDWDALSPLGCLDAPDNPVRQPGPP